MFVAYAVADTGFNADVATHEVVGLSCTLRVVRVSTSGTTTPIISLLVTPNSRISGTVSTREFASAVSCPAVIAERAVAGQRPDLRFAERKLFDLRARRASQL